MHHQLSGNGRNCTWPPVDDRAFRSWRGPRKIANPPPDAPSIVAKSRPQASSLWPYKKRQELEMER